MDCLVHRGYELLPLLLRLLPCASARAAMSAAGPEAWWNECVAAEILEDAQRFGTEMQCAWRKMNASTWLGCTWTLKRADGTG